MRTWPMRVPLSIASRMRCEPDSTPIQTSSAPAAASAATAEGVMRSTRDCIVNGMRTSSRGERFRVGLRPPRRQAEDVVREPEVIRPHGVREEADLVRDVAGAALRVARAPERLRAPVAVERAAARRHDVPREPPVRTRPRGAVRLGVHEVPGGEGKRVEVLEEGPRRRPAHGGRAVEAGPAVEREAADAVERTRRRRPPRASRARPSRAPARPGSRRRRPPRDTRRRGPSRRRR